MNLWLLLISPVLLGIILGFFIPGKQNRSLWYGILSTLSVILSITAYIVIQVFLSIPFLEPLINALGFLAGFALYVAIFVFSVLLIIGLAIGDGLELLINNK